MTHNIKIYQQTMINDIAECTLTDAEFAELDQLRSEGDVYKVRSFLLNCTHDATNWYRGDDIDGDLPHYYEIGDEQFSAVDLT